MRTWVYFGGVGRSGQLCWVRLNSCWVLFIFTVQTGVIWTFSLNSLKNIFFWSFCLRSFSCFCCSASFSSVVSSGPRRACWGLCVGPNEGRPGPSPYTAPADPRLGTLSAYSPKIRCKGVPKRDTQQVSKACWFIWKLPDSKTSDSTHPVGLIHRLVVETGADDVKRRHGDGHSHSADHGGYQSGEPAVRTEPLPEKKT